MISLVGAVPAQTFAAEASRGAWAATAAPYLRIDGFLPIYVDRDGARVLVELAASGTTGYC